MAATAVILGILIFSAQQLISPRIFEIAVTNPEVISAEQKMVINDENYQPILLTQTSIVSKPLAVKASYIDNISTIDIQVINHSLLLTNNNTFTKFESEVQQIKTDKNKPAIAVIRYNSKKLSVPSNQNTKAKTLAKEFLAEKEPTTIVAAVLDSPKAKLKNKAPAAQLTKSNNKEVQVASKVDRPFNRNDNITKLPVTEEKSPETYTVKKMISNVELLPLQEEAELISSIEPKYPSSAKRKGLELEIQVYFTIDEAGQIKNLEFEQQHKIGYFRNAIKTAMRKWAFHPAKIDGQPVESQMSKIFSFSLTG
jgi:TonB family protein